MILFIEDNPHLAHLEEALTLSGYEIEWVDNVIDALGCIEDEPGPDLYEAVIVDMEIIRDGLPDEVVADSWKVFTGWAFHKHYLCKTHLKDKTIMLTGYPDELIERLNKVGESFDSSRIVDKYDPEQLQKITSLLREFSNIL